MLTAIFGLIVLTLKLWPTTPVGRALHRIVVEGPLEFAARVDLRQMLLLGLILFGWQIVALLGPEAALVYALDLSFYAEAVVATTAAAAAVRGRYAWQTLKRVGRAVGRHVGPGRARPRARRARTPAARRTAPSNDDDHPWRALRAA
jgi:hypothetical protein